MFLSVGATVVSSIALLSASDASIIGGIGVVAGPSLGHWYAGHGNVGGIVLRSLAVAVTVGSALGSTAEPVDCLGVPDDQCDDVLANEDRRQRDALIGLGLGASVLAASAIYDSATAGRWAERWNRDHGITVAPAPVPSAAGSAPGLVIAGRF